MQELSVGSHNRTQRVRVSPRFLNMHPHTCSCALAVACSEWRSRVKTLSETRCNITQLWWRQQQQITAVQRRVDSKTSILPQIRQIKAIVGKRRDINLRIAATPVWPLTFPNMQKQPIHVQRLCLFQHNNIYIHLYIFMYRCHTFIHVPLGFSLWIIHKCISNERFYWSPCYSI